MASNEEKSVAKKPNYQHIRRQKELARKVRQQTKDQRRTDRTGAPDALTQDGTALKSEK